MITENMQKNDILVILPFKGTTNEFRQNLKDGTVNLDWVSISSFGRYIKEFEQNNPGCVKMCCLGDFYDFPKLEYEQNHYKQNHHKKQDNQKIESQLMALNINFKEIKAIFISGHGNDEKNEITAGYGNTEMVKAGDIAEAISYLFKFGIKVDYINVDCCFGNKKFPNNQGTQVKESSKTKIESICKAIEDNLEISKDDKKPSVNGFEGSAIIPVNVKQPIFGISVNKGKQTDLLRDCLVEQHNLVWMNNYIEQRCCILATNDISDLEFWTEIKEKAKEYVNMNSVQNYFADYINLNYALGYADEELKNNNIEIINPTNNTVKKDNSINFLEVELDKKIKNSTNLKKLTNDALKSPLLNQPKTIIEQIKDENLDNQYVIDHLQKRNDQTKQKTQCMEQNPFKRESWANPTGTLAILEKIPANSNGLTEALQKIGQRELFEQASKTLNRIANQDNKKQLDELAFGIMQHFFIEYDHPFNAKLISKSFDIADMTWKEQQNAIKQQNQKNATQENQNDQNARDNDQYLKNRLNKL